MKIKLKSNIINTIWIFFLAIWTFLRIVSYNLEFRPINS